VDDITVISEHVYAALRRRRSPMAAHLKPLALTTNLRGLAKSTGNEIETATGHWHVRQFTSSFTTTYRPAGTSCTSILNTSKLKISISSPACPEKHCHEATSQPLHAVPKPTLPNVNTPKYRYVHRRVVKIRQSEKVREIAELAAAADSVSLLKY
jgi:hypothetical protein